MTTLANVEGSLTAWAVAAATSAKILALVSAAVGVVGKSLWDAAVQRREANRQLRLESQIGHLEKQLSEFYWPIYLRLLQNEVIWEHILHKHNGARGSDFGQIIEDREVMPVHDDIIARLQRNSHPADADHGFRALTMAYLKHVAVFKALRHAGDRRMPDQLGVPWPPSFNREFERRTLECQREYDHLLGRTQIADPKAPSMFRDLEQEAEEYMKASGLQPRANSEAERAAPNVDAR